MTRSLLACASVAALLGLALGPPLLRAQLGATSQEAATALDHEQMMRQLGIRALRPPRGADEHSPNPANYDETLANPYPDWPDPLITRSGQRVAAPEMWWRVRRPEIVADFEREVYGRVPVNVPAVSWSFSSSEAERVGSVSVTATRVVGHTDNAAYPAVTVDIPMIVIKPVRHDEPMPVLVMFVLGRPGFPAPVQQLLADGWAVALLNPTSVQPDNGAGLTRGIIGLTNRGGHRRPDDWGALRAWAWGASRAYDYLAQDPDLDPKHIGIEGVSRYGKAALVAIAFDQRFGMVLVGSSGKGGATPYRRNFGEAVENLTGEGEYHWMAGNFLSYGVADGQHGAISAADLSVDSVELIGLCAPRLTFISYGSPAAGDAQWLDQQGSYMATVAAGRVFRLLGAQDLGVGDDYRTARMPAIGVGLTDGQLAWRQHEGGHTDVPNFKYFIAWVDRAMGRRH